MRALDVLHQARQRGLTLQPKGDKLEVSPAYDCPRDFVRTLQEYKPALVSLLVSKGRTWTKFYSERLGETAGPNRHSVSQAVSGV